MTRQIVAFGLSVVLAATAGPMMLMAQGNGLLAGTAKDEAKKPFPENSVRARDVSDGKMQGTIVGTAQLDNDGKFQLPSLPPAKYVVELLNKDGKLICAEGPFDLRRNPTKDNIKIDCGHAAAWWLLAAAGAAGITAGIVANESSAAN